MVVTHDEARAIARENLRLAVRIEALERALREAKLQIEYLHDKQGQTGSGNGVLARIDAVLAQQDARA